MNSTYKKIKINKGDTLETLSQKLGLEKQEMIAVHNIHANPKEQILYDLPNDLQELYVYPFIYQKIKDPSLKVALDFNYKLVHKPNKEKVAYGVQYFITSGEEVTEIKQELTVCYLAQDRHHFLYEIDKITPTYINDTTADLMADTLAEKVSVVYYPLTVIVNEQGKWIGIANYLEVKSRWEGVKESIYKDFEGEWIDNYVQECENNLSDENTFVESMAGHWFLNAYFAGLYTGYANPYAVLNSSFGFERNSTFPLLTNRLGLQYATKYHLQELLDEDAVVKIHTTGTLDDARSKNDLESGLRFVNLEQDNTTKATGSYSAKYFLETTTNSILSMLLECSIDLDIPQRVKIIIASLDNEVA
jgi:hypothetical protein